MEFFGELVAELFLEGFSALGQSAVADETHSRKRKKRMKILGSLIGISLPITFFIGVILLLANGTRQILGWMLIFLPMVLTGWLISLVYKRSQRKKETEKQINEMEE